MTIVFVNNFSVLLACSCATWGGVFFLIRRSPSATSSLLHNPLIHHFASHTICMASYNVSVPALAPPYGITPNFDNPSNGNGTASASLIIMMVITTLCILLRLYGKVCLMREIHPADGMGQPPLCTTSPGLGQWLTLRHHAPVLIVLAYVSSSSSFIRQLVRKQPDTDQENYWSCAWASYSLVYTPGYFVHNWVLLLRDTILPYYVDHHPDACESSN